MRALLVTVLFLGCSSESTIPRTATDAAADALDGAGDASDAADAPDGTSDCPASPPMKDAACTREGQKCAYPTDCGPSAGDFATCTSGKWSVVRNPCTAGDTGPG